MAANYKPPVLSFDIMEMVGKNVENIRWKKNMSNCLQEMSEKWSEWKASEEGQEWVENFHSTDYYGNLEYGFNFLANVPTNRYGHKQRKTEDFWMKEYNKQYCVEEGDMWDNFRDECCPKYGVW